MQVVLSGLWLPADEGVSGLDLPGGRAPPQTGNRPLIDKSDVLEMIADDLTITKVMVLLEQRVIQRFKLGVSDRFEFNGSQIAQFIL